ncbi:hypothetical protein KFE25_010037 [Diacronema lutheri]|uniref:Sugar phosphate transporter domain-containing protein n=1 Tax=Diacronema lutheri TaxID=2081491 RepID=A0A8J5XJV0_DIALT|nr:hypothetical protein KFE25_010037 [Diacronema lutheri]
MERAFFVLLYLAFNATFNLFNRWALHMSGFHFPVVMTACHVLVSTILLLPLFSVGHYRAGNASVLSSRRVLRDLAVVGVLQGLQVATNNASLVYIELSMNQVVRAMLPVVVAPFAVCIEGKVPDARQTGALVLVSVGVVMAVFDKKTMGGSALGVGLVVLSLVLLAGQLSFASKMLHGLRLDSVQVTFYTGPVAFVALAPCALVTGEAHAAARLAAARPTLCLGILLGGSLIAVLYNVIVYHTLRLFSSVGAAVVGNAKVIVVIFLAHLVLGEVSAWSRVQAFGSALTLGSAFAYAYLKMFPLGAPAGDAAARSAVERLTDPNAPPSDALDALEKREARAGDDRDGGASAASDTPGSTSDSEGGQVVAVDFARNVSFNGTHIDMSGGRSGPLEHARFGSSQSQGELAGLVESERERDAHDAPPAGTAGADRPVRGP